MDHFFPRKTITGQDVVNAMTDMEFDKFVRPLENSLASIALLRKNTSRYYREDYKSCVPFLIPHFLVWKKSQQTKKDSAAAKKKEKVDNWTLTLGLILYPLLRCSIQGLDFISTPKMFNPRSGFYLHS